MLASLAGADLADLEFCQFHPTALALPGTPHDGVLITEAIRGEGAKLLGADGERFTDELAPRDAVTAAILEEMRGEGTAAVALDLREIDPARFPNVFDALAKAGLDPRTEPVPVAPAAHYTMGGIAVDVDGRSTLPGLYAVGECSCTGLHGANRLASNSLSECFVFGGRAAAAAISEEPAASRPEPPRRRFEPPDDETRDAVWRYAGPMRNPDDLARLISNPYPLARAIGASALGRRESRGGHLRRDRPETRPGARRHPRGRPTGRRGSRGAVAGRRYRVDAMLLGVDVGGTFTDAVLLDGGTVHTAKVPTTPRDESAAVMRAVEAVLERAGAGPGEVEFFAHGMTVGTNALLEERGARTALIATRGFADLLEIGRQDRPQLYRLCAPKPAPLVEPELRFEAAERTGPEGVVEALGE